MDSTFWGTVDDASYIDSGARQIIWTYPVDTENVSEYIDKEATQDQLQNIYYSIDAFNAAHDYCIDISHKIVELYSQAFNDIHGCNYTPKEWEAMLFVWVYCFVSVAYDKYLYMKQVESVCEDFYILADSSFDVEKELISFTTNIHETKINIDILAEMMLFFGHKVKDRSGKWLEKIVLNDVGDGLCKKNEVYYHGIKGFIKQKMKKLSRKECRVFTTFGGFFYFLEILTIGSIRNDEQEFHYTITERAKLNLEARDRLCENPQTQDLFFNFAASVVGKFIPNSYIEYFSELTKMSLEVYPQSAEIIIDTNHFYFDELFKRYIMDRKSKGGTLYIEAHGGFGIFRNYLERIIADCFYTWGFIDKRCKCKPMPAVKLLQQYKYNRPYSGRYYLFCDYLPNKILFRHEGGYDRDRKQYINMVLSLFSSMSDSVAKKTVIRLLPGKVDEQYVDRLKQLNRPFTFDDRSRYSFYERVRNASLVITTAFETVWLESLIIGTPVIVVCPNELLSIMSEAEPYLKMLESVNVLVHDVKEAAEMIESISGKEVEWWNEPNRKRVVNTLKDRFAYCPKFSRLIWIKELYKLNKKKK